MAVLPEYHLTSWCPSHPDFVKSIVSSAGYLARYQALARELDINIVPGTICEAHPAAGAGAGTAASKEVQDGSSDVELRNMAYWISAGTGAVAGTYQKKNLWHPERPHLTAGAAHVPHAAFDTPLTSALRSAADDGSTASSSPPPPPPLRAGLLICWDLAFPEAFRALVADGAEVIVVASWWRMNDIDDVAYALNPRSERVFLESAVVARAYENTCAVVFCNEGGLSQVAMPILGAVKIGNGDGSDNGMMEPDTEGMRVVEVDLAVLRVAESNYKVREDMRREGWHYEYTLRKDAST